MDLLTAIKSGDDTVMIVDDAFSTPRMDYITPDDLAAFDAYIHENEDARQYVKHLLELGDSVTATDVTNNADENAATLWAEYEKGGPSSTHLVALFKNVVLKRELAMKPLRDLIEFCERDLGVVPMRFSSLVDAGPHLEKCMIAFVDFHLAHDIDPICVHEKHRDQYRSKFAYGAACFPKVVFLMSSRLPNSSCIKEFRDRVGLRSAFFDYIEKRSFADELSRKIQLWRERYPAAARLDGYLTKVGEAVKESAERTILELEQLELHDLAILEMFRLAAEKESLESYLTWVISETIACRTRAFGGLQLGFFEGGSAMPLDGRTGRTEILLELFSEVASSPIRSSGDGLMFGDIFSKRGSGDLSGIDEGGDDCTDEGHGETTHSGAVLMAISPACDLMRLGVEGHVLCVQGKILRSGRSLSDMSGAEVFFGPGVHVVRCHHNGEDIYYSVEWDLKNGLRTVLGQELQSSMYAKVARLSELFAQQIKELTLSNASRIGTPVAPVSIVNARVRVRLRFRVNGGEDVQFDECFSDCYGAAYIRGRVSASASKLAPFVMFTCQFAEWVKRIADSLDSAGAPKLAAVLEAIRERDTWVIELRSGKKSLSELDGKLLFRIEDSEDLDSSCKPDTMEIIVMPQGPTA